MTLRDRLRRWLEPAVGDNPLAGPLGRRLLGWFLVLSLLPLLISNMVGYLESRGIIEDLVRRQLAAIAEAEAQHVGDQLNRSLADLQALAAGNEFLIAGAGRRGARMSEVATREAVRDYLERKHAELEVFDALLLLRSDGALVAFSGPGDPSLYRTGSLSLPPPTFQGIGTAASDGRARFRLTVPVRDSDGSVAAYLTGVVGPDGMEHFLEIPEHLMGAIESFILDEAGRPLFISHVHGETDFGEPLASPLVGEPPGTFARYDDREGVEVIGTTVEVDDHPWIYLAEFPVAQALGPLEQLRRISLLVAGIFAVILLVSAWLVAGGIVAPVRRLVSATRRVARGDFEVRVPAEEDDEIAELGRAFNDMTEELARASARVRELHQREIERANQLATVGELASGVAHEIKNPVVGISNGLDLVRRKVGQREDLEPIMEEMSRQLDRIEGAVRDLLAFARPSEPELAEADPREIVERAARLVQPAADRAGVGLEEQHEAHTGSFQADGELLRRALVNLMMNAVQATGEAGEVVVETRETPDEVVFRVSDTGRGIPPDDLDDVFKPFYTTRHSGTGLGLPITREIVERHGGEMEVESSLGEGTTFTLRIPRSPPPNGSRPHGEAGTVEDEA